MANRETYVVEAVHEVSNTEFAIQPVERVDYRWLSVESDGVHGLTPEHITERIDGFLEKEFPSLIEYNVGIISERAAKKVLRNNVFITNLLAVVDAALNIEETLASQKRIIKGTQ